MGPPYSYNNAARPPNPYYPSPTERGYEYSSHPPSWPNSYQDGRQPPRPSHFQRQSYLPDRMYRPCQEACQRRTPLVGRVSEVPPTLSQPYPSGNVPQIRADRRLPFDRFHYAPKQPSPSPSQHYICDGSQSRGSEFATCYSSISQSDEAFSTFLKEKCQPRKSFAADTEKFVDLATMLEEFEHIPYLSTPISLEYIKKIACLRCSETGQQEYNGLILDYNSGDTLFNLFVRGVNKAYDLNNRDLLIGNIELIASLVDSLAKENSPDTPIFHAFWNATLGQDEQYSRRKKIFSETEAHSQRKNTTDQPQELGHKRRIGALETRDDHTHRTEATHIQYARNARRDQPQQPKPLKWVYFNFDEENRSPSKLNQSNSKHSTPLSSTPRKKRAASHEIPSIEKSSEETRRSHPEQRQTISIAAATSKKKAKSPSTNLQTDFAEELAPSNQQSPIEGLELSSGNFVERILREADASKRQLPPL